MDYMIMCIYSSKRNNGRTPMTSKERKLAAVAAAVRKAMLKLGREKVSGGEFFGMKQRREEEVSKAA
jgi:hypothetical protein